jgi:two-component system, OmpR family, sensor histidine kinase MtrB
VRIPVGGGFAGRVAAEARTVLLPDVDHAEVLNPILREKGIKTLLGAPLLARGRLLGVIHVGSLTPRAFTREEIDLLETAAERAALGLERALIHERLIELDRVRHRFVALASHELRTPAAAVLGSALTLEARWADLTAEQQSALRTMLAEQAQRLASLLEQLLDLSRVETHAVELHPERRRVRELVERAVAHVAEERRAEVEVDVDPALEADVDAVAVERIVANLVSNALRHGAPPVVITAAAGDEEGELRLVVEDAGSGVPADVRSRVFDEFARSTLAAGTPGSGLGLAIARSYANAHGGELVLDENGDRGARFRLMLPAR